jgi:hypothetical protein
MRPCGARLSRIDGVRCEIEQEEWRRGENKLGEKLPHAARELANAGPWPA